MGRPAPCRPCISCPGGCTGGCTDNVTSVDVTVGPVGQPLPFVWLFCGYTWPTTTRNYSAAIWGTGTEIISSVSGETNISVIVGGCSGDDGYVTVTLKGCGSTCSNCAQVQGYILVDACTGTYVRDGASTNFPATITVTYH